MSTSAGQERHNAAAGGPGPRRWLAPVGVALIAVSLLPPVLTLARGYVVAESVQFVTFAMAGPALIVLGAPWRALRLSVPLGRLAAGRRQRPSFPRAAGYLLAFVAVGLAWRLPPVMDALARHPALVAAEAVTLASAGTGLWLELVGSPPVQARLPRPHRAAIAALAMWSVWAVAYVLGLANGSVFHAYDGAGSALSAVADQELSVGLVWAVAGVCFVPVVFAALLGWLRDGGDPGEELRRMAGDGAPRAVVRGWDKPPRRGRASSA
jgi:cytochrome c oxidase assembly factor CtaG